ncbi:MAG: hypothetical protein FJ279_13040 [Planctomycetes bacterium]|nr:hypothetical protein [Planctomycetota bacterium]MBM4081884.1 hypothetical protein [Planctomycetota bacterium]
MDRVFHRWVEIYAPGIGWMPLDANRDDAKQPPYPRRYFLALPGRLLEMFRGDGGDNENLGWSYHSLRTWKWGQNPQDKRNVKLSREAAWEPAPSAEFGMRSAE